MLNNVAASSLLLDFNRQRKLLPPLPLVFCVVIYAQMAGHSTNAVVYSKTAFRHNGILVYTYCQMTMTSTNYSVSCDSLIVIQIMINVTT